MKKQNAKIIIFTHYIIISIIIITILLFCLKPVEALGFPMQTSKFVAKHYENSVSLLARLP